MYKVELLLFAIFLFISSVQSQEIKSYYCNKTGDRIKIDGKLSEKAWKDADWSDDFIDITGKKNIKPAHTTKVKMLWDDKKLYIAALIEETGIWASITERDAVIFYDNDFEVFIDPDGDTHNYVELEINAFGTIWDLLLNRPYRDKGTPISEFDIAGLESAIHINGTINDHSDIDKDWTVEIAIPFESLTSFHKKETTPKPNEHWRINFSRVQWLTQVIDNKYVKISNPSTGKPIAEKNWSWSSQNEIDMHRPERWGYLFFTDSMKTKKAVDPDEALKLYLRDLYYNQRTIKYNNGKFETSIYIVDKELDYQTSYFNKPEIKVYGNSYEIILTSKKTGIKWVINDQGLIINDALKNKNWVWMHKPEKYSKKELEKNIKTLKNIGIDGILFNGNTENFEEIIPLALRNGIEVHAWVWILNCNDSEIAKNHPDWYNVNRNGDTSCTKQAYVEYYKWLCPSNKEAIEYLKEKVKKFCNIKGLTGIHLDYIRHPDVILPVALQPKYNIVQDKEYPEYDYCYCNNCKNTFKKKYNIDIDSIADPTENKEWRQFRYNTVQHVVEEIQTVTRMHYKKLTAAVFPTPTIARKLVRQNWDKWPLDAAFPMTYQNFYNEDLEWIGKCITEGTQTANFPIYSGLYLPALGAKELQKAIEISKQKGAKGVSLFDFRGINKEDMELLELLNKKY